MTHSLSNGRELPFLTYTDHGDFISCFKRQGMNTHSVDSGRLGLVEILQREVGQKLFVVHRLDKETSGMILFGKSSSAAKELAELFENHSIEKEYLFMTDKKLSFETCSAHSQIEKSKAGEFISSALIDPSGSQNFNSETKFVCIDSSSRYALVKALPKTGKPHQIRLHAQALGMAILGDHEHGGSESWRLFLQAQKLKFQWKNQLIEIAAPDLSWGGVQNPEDLIWIWEQALYTRKAMWGKLPTSYRLCHLENAMARVDVYGSSAWVYWYYDENPTPQQLEAIKKFGDHHQLQMRVMKMNNRGELRRADTKKMPQTIGDNNAKGSNTLDSHWNLHQAETRWIASENHVQYELRSDSGLSPGLFLDQKENRLWVRQHSKDKDVLNLFSYTGGFSVCAAMGEAKSVCTVDVSKNFLEWAKQNFKINGLELEKRFEFWSQDSLLFLKACMKRNRQFDLIICDPPSLGRSADRVFSIKKDWPELIDLCCHSLRPNGILLFSTNFEVWTKKDWEQSIQQKFGSKLSMLSVDEMPIGSLDYESPDQNPLMKYFLFSRLKAK